MSILSKFANASRKGLALFLTPAFSFLKKIDDAEIQKSQMEAQLLLREVMTPDAYSDHRASVQRAYPSAEGF